MFESLTVSLVTMMAVAGGPAAVKTPVQSPVQRAVKSPAQKMGSQPAECTIYVPKWVTETKVCKETHYRWVTKNTICYDYECREVKKQVPYVDTYYVKVRKTEKKPYIHNTPIARWEDQEYTKMVPSTITKTFYRTVRKCVDVEETKIACDDPGAAAGGKSSAVQQGAKGREVKVKTKKWVCVKEPYEKEVCIDVPVKMTRKVKVYDTKKEERFLETESCTVEPRTRTLMVHVCVTEEVPIKKIVPIKVCEPYTVENTITYKVCKMVPQKVKVGPSQTGGPAQK